MVVLHALGQCLIRTAVTTITPRADACFAFVSYLTRERGNRVPRRRLEALLWPGMLAVDASHSLSELIHKLGRKGVRVHRDSAACVWLPRDEVSMDVDLLSTEPLTTMAERDLSILPGYAPRGSPLLSDWVDEWRGQMQMRVLDDVVLAISRAAADCDWPVTLALADQALKIDPANGAALEARARAAGQIARDNRSGGTARAPARRLHEAAAVSAWPARPTLRTHADDAVLVGRDLEFARLVERATGVLRGDICANYISAPAGVGKTRLVRELSSWMTNHGGATCTIACDRHDGHRPLSAFIQAVPRLQAIPGAAGCAPSTLASLSRITRLSDDARDLSPHSDSLHLSASIRDAVLDLVNAVADEQPLLLIVEDVHWTDAASWSLLRAIASTAQHSFFLVCTSRVRWQHAIWGDLANFVEEELTTLDPISARAQMTNYLGRHDRIGDARFIEWCVDTSGGNPYFIEELVNFWIATGEQYTAPPSLVSLIEARLACLGPDALRVIQAAAILGKNSTLELLQTVLEFPTHLLFSSIEELGEAGLLAADDARETQTSAPVICRHDLVIRAATRALSSQGRALIHHAAARALEPVASRSRSAQLLWDCADHWQSAGQTDRSVRAAAACARHLHDMGLVQEAIARCDAALEMCRSAANRAIVLRERAQSEYTARDWLSFCKTVAEVRTLERQSICAAPIHDDLELCELSAQRCLHRDWKAALELTLRCVLSSDADARHRVQAGINALKLATNVGDLEIMDLVYKDVSAFAGSTNVPSTDRLTLEMIYHTIRGEPQVSADAARKLLSIAGRTLPERHRLDVMINCAGALRRCGTAGEGESVYEAVFRAAVPLQCFDYAAEVCHRLIEVYSDAGQMQRAVEWVHHYQALRRPPAELHSHRNLRLAMARVRVWEGQWKKAAVLLKPPKSAALWDDTVSMFQATALAVKIRLEIGRDASKSEVSAWVAKLQSLNQRLRGTGAQDYETFSLFLGYCYIGESALAHRVLTVYAEADRRDTTPIAPEVSEALAALNLTLGR